MIIIIIIVSRGYFCNLDLTLGWCLRDYARHPCLSLKMQPTNPPAPLLIINYTAVAASANKYSYYE